MIPTMMRTRMQLYAGCRSAKYDLRVKLNKSNKFYKGIYPPAICNYNW